MSYASYTLTVRGMDMTEELLNDIKAFEAKFDTFDYWKMSNGDSEFYTNDIVYWENEHEDMINLSKKYPHCVFKLCSIPDDDVQYNCYFKDGRFEHCPYVPTKPTTIIWDTRRSRNYASYESNTAEEAAVS